MSLSKRHLDRRDGERRIDFDRLAEALRGLGEDILFAVVLGSCADGVVRPGSDLDIALWLSDMRRTSGVHLAAIRSLSQILPDVTLDIGLLNRAEPVYRFEAASGRLLFTRDPEAWLEFFSRSAREYEYQMADYARQQCYRREAARCATTA